MPKVSVIIPTYNRAYCLAEAIESILNQTFPDFELIVVDDGSTDNTKEVLKPFLDKIHYCFQENRGVSAARNTGIKKAKGPYIAFLDSDDLWLKNKLNAQMELVQQDPSVKTCYTDEIWTRKGVRVNPKKKHQKYSGWILEKMLPLCIISPSSVLIHHEVFDRVGLFDEDLPVCEDYDFWLRVGLHYPVTFINKPLIVKRGGHPDQLSRQYWGIDRFRVQALEKLLTQETLSEPQRALVIACLQEKCRILANGCFKRGKTEEGEFFLAMAKRYNVIS